MDRHGLRPRDDMGEWMRPTVRFQPQRVPAQPTAVNVLGEAVIKVRSEGLTLVSNNLREFERVEALQLANWAI